MSLCKRCGSLCECPDDCAVGVSYSALRFATDESARLTLENMRLRVLIQAVEVGHEGDCPWCGRHHLGKPHTIHRVDCDAALMMGWEMD